MSINRDILIKLLEEHREFGQRAIYYTEFNDEKESDRWDDKMISIESILFEKLGLELDSYGQIQNIYITNDKDNK